jgi:hypothetical protein
VTARPICAGLLCASALALAACSGQSMLFSGKAVSSTGQPATGADVEIAFESEGGDLRRYRTRVDGNGCFAQEIRVAPWASLAEGSVSTQVHHPEYGRATMEIRVADIEPDSFILVVLPENDGPNPQPAASCTTMTPPADAAARPAAR